MNPEVDKTKIYKWGYIVLVILAVFLAVNTLQAFRNLTASKAAPNTISLTGEGEVISVPDVATFSFTVSADAKTVAAAQELVTTKIDAILKVLKDMGVEEKDIKTTDYSVWPKYSYDAMPIACGPNYCPPSKQVPDGYTASHNVTVKIRKTDEAGKALGAVGSAGATNISGITFTTDDPDKDLEEARAMAIDDAKAKAKVLAKNLGVRLGRVVSYSDSGYNPPYPIYARGGVAMDKAVEATAVLTIPEGENKLIVNVTVTYEIR
jgi:uncharacterized protein